MRRNLLMLDLDGTVRRPIEGEWCKGENQQLFPGVRQVIDYWKRRGWVVVGVTNQGGVHYGNKSYKECVMEQRITARCAGLKYVYFCPNLGEYCNRISPVLWQRNIDMYARPAFTYRKPGEGMLIEAITWFADEYYSASPYAAQAMLSANIFKCIMVGDRPEDKEAANRIKGCGFIDAALWRNGWTIPLEGLA